MVAYRDVILSGDWLNINAEIGVANSSNLFLQNKTQKDFHVWFGAEKPLDGLSGFVLKAGADTVVDGSDVPTWVIGFGGLYVQGDV